MAPCNPGRQRMTRGRLLLHSLAYHWRGNSAVLLGVAVGTAVLTGALLVGDSLRGSLRDLALEQLGWVHHSLVSGRFVRADLATQLGRDVTPAILLQGAASVSQSASEQSANATVLRSGRVSIVGVDHRFWRYGPDPYTHNTARWMEDVVLGPGLSEDRGKPEAGLAPPLPLFAKELWDSTKTEVVLNEALASDLGVRPGDSIVLHLQKISAVPREMLLGRRDASEVLDEIKLL